MEGDQISPGRVGLELPDRAEHRPAAVRTAQEQLDQPRREVVRHLTERRHLARPGRKLDGEVVAEVAMEAAEGLDHQVVHREPDGPAPVGVAAEERRRRLAGLVVDAEPGAVEL